MQLKHRLLWLFFDADCLSRYPLGLTNLGDLEHAFPTLDRLSTFLHGARGDTDHTGAGSEKEEEEEKADQLALALYRQAVRVNQRHYANQHVYPYTCLGGGLYRRGNHREALRYWADAACVIGQ